MSARERAATAAEGLFPAKDDSIPVQSENEWCRRDVTDALLAHGRSEYRRGVEDAAAVAGNMSGPLSGTGWHKCAVATAAAIRALPGESEHVGSGRPNAEGEGKCPTNKEPCPSCVEDARRWNDFESWCEDEAASSDYLQGSHGDVGSGHTPEDWVADLVRGAQLAQCALHRRYKIEESTKERRACTTRTRSLFLYDAERAAREALHAVVSQ